MTERPVFADDWDELLKAAEALRDRAFKREAPDAATWAAIAADWRFVVDHVRPAIQDAQGEAKLLAILAARNAEGEIYRQRKAELPADAAARLATATTDILAAMFGQRVAAFLACEQRLRLIDALMWHQRNQIDGVPRIVFLTELTLQIRRELAPSRPEPQATPTPTPAPAIDPAPPAIARSAAQLSFIG